MTSPEPVRKVIVTHNDHDFTILTLSVAPVRGPPSPGNTSGTPQTLTTTWHHPFWDAGHQRWTDAHNLTPGTQLRQPDSSTVVVTGVRNVHQGGVTYDLTVGTLHTYYVLAGTAQVLVHNCDTTYVTYTKTNPETGEIYTGRSRGTGTPEQIVAARDAGHHMTEKGFGPAVLDQSATATKSVALRHSDPSYQAIRGREQQLIDAFGGAQSAGGTSGNAIRGIAEDNPLRGLYLNAATAAFGGP
nr:MULTISPECIES: polymorphic toxin-type HINT domain-containing protein [Streptomyces]